MNNKRIAIIEKDFKVKYVNMTDPSIILYTELSDYLQDVSVERIKTYIHNLPINGSLLTLYLLKNGYTHSNNGLKKIKTFKKIEGDDGSIFSIDIKVNSTSRPVKFVDSKKILNFTPDELFTSFLDIKRDRMDDLEIVSKSLQIMFEDGFTRDTMSANAWNTFKEFRFKGDDGKVNNSSFRNILPTIPLSIDDFIRESYRGGWVHLRKDYNKEKHLSGISLDVNSLFPSVMYSEKMPWGTPEYFIGEYQQDDRYPLYIQKMTIGWIVLKNNKVPFLNFDGFRRLLEDEYVEFESNITVTLTSVDYELLKECYDFGDVEFLGGYKFRSISNLFTEYIDHFMEIKNNEKGSKRQVAKLFLNSLYGKFGSKVIRTINNYKIDEDGVELKVLEDFNTSGTMYYTAIASFISSYARAITIRGANNNYKYFIYADTDSLHLNCSVEDVKELIIDDKKLGAWQLEKTYIDSIFLGNKTYGQLDENGWEFKIAGLPKEAIESIKSKDEFYIGAPISCKVKQKSPDGIEYVERVFKLASSKIGKI